MSIEDYYFSQETELLNEMNNSLVKLKKTRETNFQRVKRSENEELEKEIGKIKKLKEASCKIDEIIKESNLFIESGKIRN